MRYVDILQEIEALPSKRRRSLRRLLQLADHRDEEVRFRAIERLGEYPSETVIRRLHAGLEDTDELVRIACLEILGDWRDEASIDLVTKCLDDDDELVRCAAADALGDIGNTRSVRVLEPRIAEASDRERMSLYAALCELGREKYFERLLNLLKSEDYRTRCAVANTIWQFVNESNKKKVLEKLLESLEVEDTIAARSSIEEAIEDLIED